MNIYIVWALWFLLAEVIISVPQFLLKKKKLSRGRRATLIAFKFVLAAATGVLPLAGPVFLRPVQPLLFGLYAALFADFVADVIYSVSVLLRKGEREFNLFKALSVVWGLAFFVLGTVNMQTVTPVYTTVSSPVLTRDCRVAVLADVHIGTTQSEEVIEKTVGSVAAEKPDFVILCGDVTDDYTTKEQAEDYYSLFKDFSCPVYFVYGNHDRQPHAKYAGGIKYTADELYGILTSNGIKVLADETVKFSDEIYILGREDMSMKDERKDLSALSLPANDKFLIVADHQPNDAGINAGAGADLQVSGHTHGGQLFPFRLFYDLFVCDACGEYEYGDMKLIVSAGVSGWRVPFRTEGGCHYEIITLKAEK